MEDSHVITHYMAGQQNRPSPFQHAASRDSMSHNWRGPGFYSTQDKRFILLKDTTSGPSTPHSGASYARGPTLVPTSTLRSYSADPWTRQWRGPGAGFYSPKCHTWSRELPGLTIAPDSRLFFNEEDWMKYKHMCANPTLKGAKLLSGGLPPVSGMGANTPKPSSRQKNILSTYL